jgi:hypothetical protein
MIPKWLEEEKWELAKIDNTNFQLCYKVTLSSRREIYLGVEESIDRISIQNTLTIPPEVKASYKLSPNKYKFLYDLKVYLMLMEISTEITPSFEELESIHIANFIYFDEFLRNKFIHEIYKLADATDLIIIMWKRFTESHFPSSQQKS